MISLGWRSTTVLCLCILGYGCCPIDNIDDRISALTDAVSEWTASACNVEVEGGVRVPTNFNISSFAIKTTAVLPRHST